MQKHQIDMLVDLVIAQRTHGLAVLPDIGQNRNGRIFRVAVPRIGRVGYGLAKAATDTKLVGLAQVLVTTQ